MRVSFSGVGVSPTPYTAKQLDNGTAPEGIYRLSSPAGAGDDGDRFVVTGSTVLVYDPASGDVARFSPDGWPDSRKFVPSGEKSVTLTFE